MKRLYIACASNAPSHATQTNLRLFGPYVDSSASAVSMPSPPFTCDFAYSGGDSACNDQRKSESETFRRKGLQQPQVPTKEVHAYRYLASAVVRALRKLGMTPIHCFRGLSIATHATGSALLASLDHAAQPQQVCLHHGVTKTVKPTIYTRCKRMFSCKTTETHGGWNLRSPKYVGGRSAHALLGMRVRAECWRSCHRYSHTERTKRRPRGRGHIGKSTPFRCSPYHFLIPRPARLRAKCWGTWTWQAVCGVSKT